MKTRSVLGIVIVLIASRICFGQDAQLKQQLKQGVAADEAVVQKAEAAHLPGVELARLYWHLGFSYAAAAELGRAETALAHSVSLFRQVPGDDKEVATALNSLAILHVGTEDLRDADKEANEAMRLREKLGDRLELAESWHTLATVALKKRQYARARDFATKAVTEFNANAKADAWSRIGAQYALGMSLCGLKDYVGGVRVFKDAVVEARAKLPEQDLSISLGQYLLGLAYWKSGDMADAGRELQAGITGMGRRVGPEYPNYVASLELYAKYLRQTRQVEAAKDVEWKIQQAGSTVDVRSLQSGPAALGFDAMR